MRGAASLFLVMLLWLPACGDRPRHEVVVSAAASLADAFAVLEAEFEAAHPDVDIVLNLGGSSTLREQILAGAPVDVFASANVAVMSEVVAAGLAVGAPVEFASNRLVIAVPAGNPGEIVDLTDLGDPQLLVGLCAEEVPCGALASRVLAAAGVTAVPDTLEPDVRSLRTKLELGELDVGLVYASDVVDDESLDSIAIGDGDLLTRYTIAVLEDSTEREAASLFVDSVTSTEGAALLARFGFGSP